MYGDLGSVDAGYISFCMASGEGDDESAWVFCTVLLLGMGGLRGLLSPELLSL